MTARNDALNLDALQTIKGFADIREFSEGDMSRFKEEPEAVLNAEAALNADFASILVPWRTFRDGIQEWHGLAEISMLRARGRQLSQSETLFRSGPLRIPQINRAQCTPQSRLVPGAALPFPE